jgi:hypothetical protein
MAAEKFSQYLMRSKGMPLSITLKMPKIPPDLFELLSRHSGLILSLHLETNRDTITQIADAELVMPLLESLEITFGFFNHPSSAPPTTLPLIKIPALRHLKLVDYGLWPAGIYHNLISLDLQNHMSFTFFLDVLEENPRLQSLTVQSSISEWNVVAPPRIAKLPCLARLVLKQCNSRLILSHILTQSKYVEVNNYLKFRHETAGAPVLDLFEAVPEHLFNQGSPQELRILIIGLPGREAEIHISITVADASGSIIILSEDIYQYRLMRVPMLSRQLHGALKHDAFQGLTHIVIEVQRGGVLIDHELSSNDWRVVLGHFKNLRLLEVRSIAPVGALLSELAQYDSNYGVPDAAFRCRHLQVLRLAISKKEPEEEQFQVLGKLSNLIDLRHPSSNPRSSADPFAEVELGLWLNPEDLPLAQIEEHLARWRSYGVKKAQIFNQNVLVSSFSRPTISFLKTRY